LGSWVLISAGWYKYQVQHLWHLTQMHLSRVPKFVSLENFRYIASAVACCSFFPNGTASKLLFFILAAF